MTASYNTIIVVGGSAGTHSILIEEPVSSVASRSDSARSGVSSARRGRRA
jgi:hypothetical protein